MDERLQLARLPNLTESTAEVATSIESLASLKKLPVALDKPHSLSSQQYHGHRKHASEPTIPSELFSNFSPKIAPSELLSKLNPKVAPFVPVQPTSTKNTSDKMSSSGEEEVVYDREKACMIRRNNPVAGSRDKPTRDAFIADANSTLSKAREVIEEWDRFRTAFAAAHIHDENYRELVAAQMANMNAFYADERVAMLRQPYPSAADQMSDTSSQWTAPMDAFNTGERVAIAAPHQPYPSAAGMSDNLIQAPVRPQRSVLPEWLAEFDDLKPTPTVPSVDHAGGAAVKPPTQSKGKDKAPAVQMSQKLLDRTADDGLTLVGSRMTIWNDRVKETAHVDWPPPQEFGKYGRRLPPPRIQQLDPSYAHLAQGPHAIPMTGPGVPYELRQLAPFSVNPTADGLTTEEVSNPKQKVEEIKIDEVNGFLRELLEDIAKEE
ncbi:hypothetical protein F4818DRAFT_435649 [Hypoxylon cercidicola]|nr:hypothetical protein F4818DRAFT_435649 [Hypoxylon cercidicola]